MLQFIYLYKHFEDHLHCECDTECSVTGTFRNRKASNLNLCAFGSTGVMFKDLI